MKKFIYLFLSLICSIAMMTSCHGVRPNADEEAVLIKKPWFFFLSEGVDPTPVTAGCTWCLSSTSYETFKIVPVKYEEKLNDIISNENTPLDFNTQIIIRIKKGKSPILLENYGKDWYNNNVKEVYNKFTRHYVSMYSPFDLTSNREVIEEIDKYVKRDMENYIKNKSKEREFPIVIEEVITGRAIPNEAQLTEMNNTAAQIQAKQTQERRREMEVAREKTEKQRAIADKAYQNEMGLSTKDYIALKAWDIIKEKNGANIDVLFNSNDTEKMWNIRR